MFTISAHFLYFVHYNFRENDVSITGLSSRLLLFNNLLGVLVGFGLFAWVSFPPWGFSFFTVILLLSHGVFPSWQALRLPFLEASTVKSLKIRYICGACHFSRWSEGWMEGLQGWEPLFIEWQNSLGLKGPLQADYSNAPAVSRDVFNYIRFLGALSSLAWNVSSDGYWPPFWATCSSVSPSSL